MIREIHAEKNSFLNEFMKPKNRAGPIIGLDGSLQSDDGISQYKRAL